MTDDERRKEFKAYTKEWRRVDCLRNKILREHSRREWQSYSNTTAPGSWNPMLPPSLPEYPTRKPWMDSLTCGAKTRAGTPCKITAIYGSGRCKLHGGLSTGPTTPEGKAKAAKNGQKRGEPHERYGKVGFPRE